MKMKIHENPKLFEWDKEEEVIDIFIRKDPDCPYPFSNGIWYHQGFHEEEFIEHATRMLEKLGYMVVSSPKWDGESWD